MDSLEVRLGLVELEPMEAFWKNPCELNLTRISKTLHTTEMLEAIFNNPQLDTRGLRLLSVVSKRLITYDVCLKSVLRDARNVYLVPEKYIDTEFIAFMSDHHISLYYFPKQFITKEICEKAVGWSWRNLKYVPPKLKTKKLCECALNQNIAAITFYPARLITPELAIKAVKNSDSIIAEFKSRERTWPIAFIPHMVRTDELIDLSLSLFPESIEDIPSECMTEERAIRVVQCNGYLLKYIPKEFRSKERVFKAAVKQNPEALIYVPEEKITHEMCNDVYERIKDNTEISFSIFPEQYRDEYQRLNKRLKPAFHTLPLRLMAEEEKTTNDDRAELIESKRAALTVYDVALSETESKQRIYYVSDLHLEHQLDLDNRPFDTVAQMIEEKVQELILDVPDRNCTLIISGDVSDGEMLTNLFLRRLRRLWNGDIFFAVGNHELWDAYSETDRTVDEVITQLKRDNEFGRLHMLENELCIYYKGGKWVIISEKDILESGSEELKTVCDKSTFIILGGNGFSGCNPKFNADRGLYRDKLSRKEEVERSLRFRKIHDKIMSCLEDTRIVVLTHTPPEDWTTGKLCSKWIYISGHSHHNRYQFNDNEPCILADNQIGYKPRKWNLKCFEYECMMRYDPLAYLPDGIHEITASQYTDVNRCFGIAMSMNDFKRQGHIYAIKRCGVYMFIYESRKISILAGGGLRTGHHTKQYYYDHMPLYISRLNRLFSKYYNALKYVSDEVKKIGGSGRIHGSIVDIDFYNHLFLDPRQGAIKPYYAEDMIEKIFYQDINHLIKESPHMYDRELYLKRLKGKQFEFNRLLSTEDDTYLTKLPEIVFDTEMYQDSRKMCAVQYVMEQKVIRFWNDEILAFDS